jgi:hypothetical protein
MQVFYTSQQSNRPVIRKPYDFGVERVHLAIDPTYGDPIPLYHCDSCGRNLNVNHYDLVTNHHQVGSRVVKFKYVAAMHPECKRCRKQIRGKHAKHPLFSAGLATFFAKLVMGTKGGARARGILCSIDKDDALGMYLDQGGYCALTGLKMDWETSGYTSRNGRNYKAPSIDRIDSRGNYVLGNIQVVIQAVNIMKNDLPMDQFVAMCRRVADHNISLV